MNRHSKKTKRPASTAVATTPPEIHAFVLVVLPHVGGRPHWPGDHYATTDPFYACLERGVCECPFSPTSSGFWKASTISPGGAFDGRVRGQKPLKRQHAQPGVFEEEWNANCLSRSTELAGPMSAFAVVSPDGIWHQCVEPEPQDFIVGDVPRDYLTKLTPATTSLTRLQVAWRSELAYLLSRYQHHHLLGCDASMVTDPPRKCAEDERVFRHFRD